MAFLLPGQKRQLEAITPKPLRKGRFCYAKNGVGNRTKNRNGSKACAWLIYKSAAKPSVRLRRTLALALRARAPKPSARPNGQTNRKPDRKRGEGTASPLNRSAIAARIFRRARLSFHRFCTVIVLAVTGYAALMSLSATELSLLCRSTVLCILPLSSTRNRQRV